MRASLPPLLLMYLLAVLPLSSSAQSAINPENIEIVRDQWGVPHIYANTDAEAAYGLAWANAEDDFFTMQDLLITVQGKAGLSMGKAGAERDFFTHAVGVRRVVEAQMDQIPNDFLRYVQGFVEGFNAYAKAHPHEIRVKSSFPVQVEDIIASYVFVMTALTKAPGAVKGIMDGTFDNKSVVYGSNAFSFNSQITEDGGTMLCINPHQPVTGPFSWYEAHLVSDEGLNMHGAVFPGGSSIFLGNNAHLGWAHTVNHLDLLDVFKLEMHPTEKLQYKYNGEWLKLEERKVKLRVKLKKWLPAIPVRKTTYWSEIGATLQSEDGSFYAIKLPATERIHAGEQWYRMNKATNFTEFYDALSLGQTTMFNIVYADRYDTIFYINNAVMPKRIEGFNYSEVIGVNSDKAVWNEFHPVEDLVQYVNPDCGYIFNTNNLPTNATCAEEQRSIEEWPEYFGFDLDLGNNNRALRFMDLIALPGRMSFDRMKEIKFDRELRECTVMYESIESLLYLELDDPELQALQNHIIRWDGCADKGSVGAAVYLLTFQFLFDAKGYDDKNFKKAIDVTEQEYLTALSKTREHLDRYFGGQAVPLGQLQRHVRADVNLPLAGFPDALSANYNEPWKDGKYKPFVGDSYIHFVHWMRGTDLPYMETLHPFGSSNRPSSPHYTDQMERYVNQHPKVMTLDREAILRNAEAVYSPGMR